MKRAFALLALCTASSAFAQQQPGDEQLIHKCDGTLSQEQSYALARHWIDAWNSTSPEAVMALYTSDFEFRGPGIITSKLRSDPSGVLRGQADNRMRWFGRNDTKPGSQFRLIAAYAGVRSITVFYNGPRGQQVTEVNEYAPDCKIERSNAMYGPLLPGVSGRPPTAANASK